MNQEHVNDLCSEIRGVAEAIEKLQKPAARSAWARVGGVWFGCKWHMFYTDADHEPAALVELDNSGDLTTVHATFVRFDSPE